MRWHLALLALLGACSPAGSGGSARPAAVEVPASPNSDEHTPASEPASPSCAVEPPRVEERALESLIPLGALMGKTWLLANRVRDSKREPVLVHLDRQGRLLETPLPGFTEDVAFEPPSTIHFLDYAPSVRWWSVDVSAPDAPKPSAPKPGPALGFDNSSRVKAFAVSGNRALISVYRVKYGGPETIYAGATALYDRATGARRGSPHPFTTWAAQCGRFGCVGLSTNASDDKSAELVTLDASGVKARKVGNWDCLRVANWRDGAHWLLALADAAGFRALSVELSSGKLSETSAPALNGCRSLVALELGARRGVMIETKEFVPISTEPRIAAGERLPEFVGRSQELAPLPDGALVADVSADSWLMHGPTDSRGIREYHREWRFEGRAGLLRSAGNRAWKLEASSRLPGDQSEGSVYGELDAASLSNGNFAAVIVYGGGKSQVVLLSQPCN